MYNYLLIYIHIYYNQNFNIKSSILIYIYSIDHDEVKVVKKKDGIKSQSHTTAVSSAKNDGKIIKIQQVKPLGIFNLIFLCFPYILKIIYLLCMNNHKS